MKRHILSALIVIILISFSLCHAEEPGKNLVTAQVEKEGDRDLVMITNNAPCDVTVTVSFAELENGEVNVTLPYTTVVRSSEAVRTLAIRPVEPSKPLKYHYDIHWKYGSFKAVTDLRMPYLLPYKPGSSYMVMQAYNGDFTHKGDARYSIDWEMPTGTEICAAREGTVIDVRDSYEGAGTKNYYLKRANYILILHRDGTIAEYAHIQKGGAKVAAGRHVSGGEIIALSGNVGYSLGPHLHFCVFIPVDGTRVKTIPVSFKTKISDNSVLTTGDKFEAPGEK